MLKNKNQKIITTVLFMVYLAVLVYVLLFKGSHRLSPHTYTSNHHGLFEKPSNFNLIPFTTIKLFFVSFSANKNLSSLYNLLGNVLIFVPFGIFVSLLWSNKKSFVITFLTGSFVILLIELIQLITVWGILDIDDYLLNILGVILGWLLSRIFVK
ncbi:MAG: VanZ family protein [Saccharofermentanales bacterium]|jgi:glycopeptide antibiotics resistance protein